MEVIYHLIELTVGKTVLRGHWKLWENLKKTNQMKNKAIVNSKKMKGCKGRKTIIAHFLGGRRAIFRIIMKSVTND